MGQKNRSLNRTLWEGIHGQRAVCLSLQRVWVTFDFGGKVNEVLLLPVACSHSSNNYQMCFRVLHLLNILTISKRFFTTHTHDFQNASECSGDSWSNDFSYTKRWANKLHLCEFSFGIISGTQHNKHSLVILFSYTHYSFHCTNASLLTMVTGFT